MSNKKDSTPTPQQKPQNPELSPEVKAINDQMKPLLQQLGMHYSNREASQKAIDKLESQLDGMKTSIRAIQQKG